MIRLPSVTGKDVVRALGAASFGVVRVRGSDHILKHPDGRQTVVPVHSGESIGPGLLHKILRDCDISKVEFDRLVHA